MIALSFVSLMRFIQAFLLLLASSGLWAMAPQRLKAEPSVAQVGSEIVLTAISGEGTALASVTIQAVTPDGTTIQLGATDANGQVRFQPAVAGDYVFSTEVDGARVILGFVARPETPRLWYALACVPVGLLLLYANARRLGRRARA